jgi:hypothetical protein
MLTSAKLVTCQYRVEIEVLIPHNVVGAVSSKVVLADADPHIPLPRRLKDHNESITRDKTVRLS